MFHSLCGVVLCSSGKASPHGSVMPPGALQAEMWQPGATISSNTKVRTGLEYN